VIRALECGWRPDEISYTGTNVSERDLDVLVAHGIHLNLDAISQIERYGRRAPGSRIGLRIDPGAVPATPPISSTAGSVPRSSASTWTASTTRSPRRPATPWWSTPSISTPDRVGWRMD
jgi:hypothetical protein